MIKLDETTLPGSTLSKADEQEPIFVIRAQDKSGPAIVRIWVLMARLLGAKPAKIREAADCASMMEQYQAENGCKVPD